MNTRWHEIVKTAISDEDKGRKHPDLARVDRIAIRHALRESRFRKTVRVKSSLP